ncbi:MAG: FAD-binding protein [Peptococcaceae bacterium]|nr:FAD-binding protein [Peptococcaceae bacterium]
MKNWETDVLVIGSGLAGLRAAIEARRAGTRVLVVSRAPIGKANNSAISKGQFAVSGGEFHPGDSAEQHMKDILAGGGRIGDPRLVSVMVENLKDEVGFLRDCGVSLASRDDGSLRYGKPPGHTYPRVLGTARSFGVDLLDPLAARALEMGVSMEQGVTLLSLAGGGEGTGGAWGVTRRGEPVFIEAAAVILATGGAGGLYLNTNNAPGSVGLGLAMALDAGLSLVDMEFVQFYPTYLRMPGKPRVMVFYEVLVAVAGAVLRNSLGQDIRELYDLNDASSLTRDRLSRAIAAEISAGRGVGPGGEAVIMDLSAIAGMEKYRRLIPRAVPPEVTELHVAPVAHFTMGGVAVKPGGGTGIPGLWAVGEVAGGIHGANRIGGNALAECLALGRAAGGAAAEYSLRAGQRKGRPKYAEAPFDPGAGAEDLSPVEETLRRAMSSRAGILRDAGGLEEALAVINSLGDKISGRKSVSALKLGMMLDVARAVCLSALMRRESRGSHFRLDHPGERDDYLGNFLVKKANGEVEATFVPRGNPAYK